MRWVPLGKVFDPTDFDLPAGCVEFAQAPQTLIFDDFVRVYFSTRSRDPLLGKPRSHIAFVDMDKTFSKVIQVSASTAITPGDIGCFDEHGIFPISVVRHGGAIYGYTCGWSRRLSVSVETAIGLAISRDDGLTFQRIGPGPVLAASLNEPYLVGDAFVKVIGTTFHMWYIFGTNWIDSGPGIDAERVYKIGHAVSADGLNWIKDDGRQIIADRLGDLESQALPSVVDIAGRYHMFFCFRESIDFRTNPTRGYRIGHAYSDDLETWIRDDFDPEFSVSANSWDSDMQCYPHAFECDGKVLLLYNGNEFGRLGFGLAELRE